MKNDVRKTNPICFKLPCFTVIAYLAFLNFSCTKQEVLKQRINASDSTVLQINYLAKIKNSLKDSISKTDFSTLDFNKISKSNDVRTEDYFLRVRFKNKKFSDDFILLKTDATGNIVQGKIVHIQLGKSEKPDADITIVASSLDRKDIRYVSNANRKKKDNTSKSKSNISTRSNVSSLLAEEQPVGEQDLPDVVVTGYIYDDPMPYYWYSFDDILGTGSGGGGSYTYGSADVHGGGGGIVYPDETINIQYENADQPPIDITKYIKCFSLLPDQGSTYKLSIYSDIPVNNDAYKLFDFSTGDCGHTFLQLTKTNGTTTIQQNIGFYPESGWKSIEANSPVTSKLVDNAGHEFNASLTVNIDATHFQTALNEIQYYGKAKYDIDNFNCTDFALNVFNSAAPLYLEIPAYHIPGGMYGELSNTPQGLYNELSSLSKSGGYAGGQIAIPGVAGYTGSSHGACN